MELTGTQYQQLQNALLSAFPSQTALAQMVRFRLNQVLSQIADGSNDTERVFNLIGWAETNGKLDNLIDGALAANPDNDTLRTVVGQLRPAPEAAPPAKGAP